MHNTSRRTYRLLVGMFGKEMADDIIAAREEADEALDNGDVVTSEELFDEEDGCFLDNA